mgnify:CR=1 FL=1
MIRFTVSLTLGWVVDVVLSIVLSLPELVLSGSDKAALARAFNKISTLGNYHTQFTL